MLKTAIASLLSLTLLAGAAAANPGWLKEDLNFRYGPGTRYGVIAALPECTRVHVYDYVGGWYRATWNGITGYVSARFVSDNDGHCYAPKPRHYSRKNYGHGHAPQKRGYSHGYTYGY